MKAEWHCRDYQAGDEHQILALFGEVFGRELSLAFWKWRFVNNPFGRGMINLLFDGDKLIGHYAVIPMDVQVQGKLLKAVFSMTTMTHADYGGQGIFTYLAEETYRLCHQRGYQFVYGLPNRNSYSGFTRKLGWRGLGRMAALERKLPTGARTGSIARAIKPIEHFDDKVNSLWDKVKQDYTVIIPRTREFLNWRFVQNPDVGYAKFVFANNEELSGYVVLKVYSAPDGVKGHIVDMLTIESEEVVGGLLDCSYGYLAAQGIDNLSCWCQDNCFHAHILESEGFTSKEMEGTYFGVRIFDQQDDAVKPVEYFPNWFLSMGDSDAF